MRASRAAPAPLSREWRIFANAKIRTRQLPRRRGSDGHTAHEMILSEEQKLIRDTARAFAREKVAPHARAWEAAGEIPRALLAEMGTLGFMGMCVPAEWG